MRELLSMIGKTGTYNLKGWTIRVKVIDVKQVYGTDKLEVENVLCPGETQYINRDSFREDYIVGSDPAKESING